MTIEAIANEKELKQVLWACYNYWDNESKPVEKREICYAWVNKEYKKRYDKEFNESGLTRLADHGIISATDKTRGSNRVFFHADQSFGSKGKIVDLGYV